MNSLVEVTINISTFFVFWISTWVAIAFPLFKRYNWRPFQPTTPEKKLILLLPLYLMALISIWGANHLLGQSWKTIGVIWEMRTTQSLLLGVGIATIGIWLLLLLKASVRLISFDGVSRQKAATQGIRQHVLTIGGLFLLAIMIGGIEEIIFRGWLQTQLEMAMVPWLAATLGSFLFAIAHLIWDGRAGLWQQPGLFLLGWVLVIARWADSGNIALAWGLHTGWVWGLACIGELIQPQPVTEKPVWLAGRPAQPLTDLLDVALMIITAGLIWQILAPLG